MCSGIEEEDKGAGGCSVLKLATADHGCGTPDRSTRDGLAGYCLHRSITQSRDLVHVMPGRVRERCCEERRPKLSAPHFSEGSLSDAVQTRFANDCLEALAEEADVPDAVCDGTRYCPEHRSPEPVGQRTGYGACDDRALDREEVEIEPDACNGSHADAHRERCDWCALEEPLKLAERLADALEEEPVWVCVGERVVEDVAVAVEVLEVERVLHERIGREEPSHHGVVDAPAHVHEAELLEELMPGEVAVGSGDDAVGGVVLAGHVPALTPHVVALARAAQQPVGIEQRRRRAEMILQLPQRGDDAGARARLGDQRHRLAAEGEVVGDRRDVGRDVQPALPVGTRKARHVQRVRRPRQRLSDALALRRSGWSCCAVFAGNAR